MEGGSKRTERQRGGNLPRKWSLESLDFRISVEKLKFRDPRKLKFSPPPSNFRRFDPPILVSKICKKVRLFVTESIVYTCGHSIPPEEFLGPRTPLGGLKGRESPPPICITIPVPFVSTIFKRKVGQAV